MPRKLTPKTRCSGKWTESQYTNFIRGTLRKASMHWAPISETLREAKVKRGVYTCASCGKDGPASIRIDGKKYKNAVVDHIEPIVDPETGFVSWDEFINKLFCEKDKLQVLCHECHTRKTNEERAKAAEFRRKNNG